MNGCAKFYATDACLLAYLDILNDKNTTKSRVPRALNLTLADFFLFLFHFLSSGYYEWI